MPFTQQAFTYPPGAIFFFWPILWVPEAHLALLRSAGSLVALVGAYVVVLDHLLHRHLLETLALSCWLSVLSVAAIPPVTECFTWGQTATVLLAFVVADLLVMRGPAKGVLVGVAAAVKIYPGVFIVVWLLRREWRAAATAFVTWAAVTGAAWALWPTSASTFLHDQLLGGGEFDKLTNNLNSLKSSSLSAFFSRPPFHYGILHGPEVILISAVAVAVALAASQRLWRQGLALSSVVVVLIVVVIAAPVAWDHYFAFAPLLALMVVELGWRSPLARTAVAAFVVMLVPWFIFRQPSAHTTWTATYAFVARNAILFVSVAVLVASFWPGEPSTRPTRTLPRVGARSLEH